LTVEYFNSSGQWQVRSFPIVSPLFYFLLSHSLSFFLLKVVLNDGDWDTRMMWQRYYIAESLITITWTISDTTRQGTYRIGHFGNSKSIWGDITPYSGYTSSFNVTSAAAADNAKPVVMKFRD
jgi:hypothetical protein